MCFFHNSKLILQVLPIDIFVVMKYGVFIIWILTCFNFPANTDRFHWLELQHDSQRQIAF